MPSQKEYNDRTTQILKRWMGSLSPADRLAFGFPEYGAGGSELLSYLNEKREMGIVEEVTGSVPPDVKVTALTNVGAYLEVLEPWLHRYVRDCRVSCKVEARYLGGNRLIRRELRSLAIHFEISVRMEVTRCFKGDGVFQYNGP